MMTKEERAIYYKAYRINNKDACNKASRDCMRRKREAEYNQRLISQRRKPKAPQYIQKSMEYIKKLTRTNY